MLPFLPVTVFTVPCSSLGAVHFWLVVWFLWGFVGSVVFVLLFCEILEIHTLVHGLCTMHTWRLHSCKKIFSIA